MKSITTLRWTAASLTVLLAFASDAFAGVAPENVAIVVNGDSKVSKLIAEEYVRLLPAAQ